MNKPKPQTTATHSQQEMLENAQAHLRSGRFKEATGLFKDLLKQSNDAEYRKNLAECYLQRAKSMATKSMLKEACILWENYAEHAAAPFAEHAAYVLWLLASKNTSKAFAEIRRFDARQMDEDNADLATWLGFLLLSGMTDMLPHLPKDSMLLRHWELITEALEAYQTHDAQRCEQILANIPFRSAFRDLRSLLKAQLLATNAPDQALSLLAKITKQSPYRQAADALSACLQSGTDFINSAAELDTTQRRIIADAKSISTKHQEFLETFIKQRDHLDTKACFNLGLRYRDVLGVEATRAHCLSVVAHDHKLIDDYIKQFAKNDAFEANRVQALLYEQADNPFDADYFWGQCIDTLKRDRSENNLKIAFILRHMATHNPPAEAAELLSESLQLDPNDRQSYLLIQNIFSQNLPNTAKYAEWLELSLQRFPADTEFLVRATKLAASKKAFKKAAAYAKTLLKSDPVNTLAKQLLFANHMAHARKLLKAGKYHLVDKELQAAAQLSINKNLRQQSELLRGFLRWQSADQKQGLQDIVDTLGKLNTDPVSMQFQAQMEAELLELASEPLSKALPAAKNYLLSDKELQHLIESIEYYDQQLDNTDLLLEALDSIKAPLKKSIQWLLEHEAVLLSWCEILQRIGHYELLKQCAKPANTRWRKPIWIYYITLAGCRGDASRLDFMALLKLQNAAEEARTTQDSKTAFLLDRLIDQSRNSMNPFELADVPEEFEQELTETDPLDDLFGHLPDSVMIKISKRIERMLQKIDPDRFVASYIQQYAKIIEPQKLAILFMNPDFFSSITLLAAAEELKIDIGVSFEDVVARFSDDTPQYSLPFL